MALTDYLFCLYFNHEHDQLMIAIVRKSYWKKHHCLEDTHLENKDPQLKAALRQLGLAECMDSTFDLTGTASRAGKTNSYLFRAALELRKLGLKTDPALDAFINTHGGLAITVQEDQSP